MKHKLENKISKITVSLTLYFFQVIIISYKIDDF